jgi:hypothetical protein
MKARTDSFAGSAIPIDDVDSDATLIQTNDIIVSANASILSAQDIRLHAERFGFAHMESKAKAVNWASAAGSAINSALGGAEQNGGSITTNATGRVNVAGTLQTGTKRNRSLTLGVAPVAGQPSGWNVDTGMITSITNASGAKSATRRPAQNIGRRTC